MINFDLIKNTELRLLVTASESINSLPSETIQEWVGKIANLPEDGQKEMIAALKDEQLKMSAARIVRHTTPESEMQQVKKSAALLNAASQGFFAEVGTASEEASRKQEGPAENILNSL